MTGASRPDPRPVGALCLPVPVSTLSEGRRVLYSDLGVVTLRSQSGLVETVEGTHSGSRPEGAVCGLRGW